MKKAFVTGANGFLGRYLINFLKKKKYNIIFPGSKECNLVNEKSLLNYGLKKKYIFDEIYHLAAWTQAGDFCLKYPGDQWIINQKINTNVLYWWKNYQPQAKLIFIGTSCAYAENSNYKEINYMAGEPTPSLYTYAMTKRMLLQGAISMQNQFGMKWLCLVPSTLYGINYHQDNRQMHFIFDLVKKIVDGKYNKTKVILWGDGNQKREIINVEDFICTLFNLRKKNNEIINIGSGESFSIKYFARIISKIVGFSHNKIIYDKTKYVGARNKKLDITKVSGYLKNYTNELINIEDGLKEVVNWYIKKNY
jgi:GDP-L-fucose synthase